MLGRFIVLIVSSLTLAGCVTTGDSKPVKVSAEDETALRRWLAIQINGSGAAYGVMAQPAVSKATISGPFESSDLLGQGTRYCVNAELDTVLLPTQVSASVVIRAMDGKVSREFSVVRNSSQCSGADAKPFPELIEERAKVRQKFDERTPTPANRP
ncbi:MAG: hypothetical protein CFE31_02655 [Rhizobiales bacterium PAR1]|nr:MAG: hypothetical protein CFE31_02655 [Rhizobiales bacterium PAR1]